MKKEIFKNMKLQVMKQELFKNMKTQFYHEYKGYHGFLSRCLVKIVSKEGKYFICFENINEGTSVTNMSEQLASDIVEKMGFDPNICRFFEYYPETDYESFDEIEYDWNYVSDHDHRGYEYIIFKAKHPHWKPASQEIKDIFLT